MFRSCLPTQAAKIVVVVVMGLAGWFPFVVANESETTISIPRRDVTPVDQRVYRKSENGCGPASVLNLLKFSSREYQAAYETLVGGDEETRMSFVIDRYFRNRGSEVIDGSKRWGIGGILSEDLLAGVNDLLEEKEIESLAGAYLDRRDGETDQELIGRIHRVFAQSIENGVAPILSLRSFRVKKEGEKQGWEASNHHNVVVLSISPIQDWLGFSVEVIDPWGGMKRNIFIHREPASQAFRALKGTEETGRWLAGSPFLLAVAPQMTSLRPHNLKFSERLIITANYAIGDF